MYLYIICRDLAKSTFTHLPCGTIWKGRQKMEEHTEHCSERMTEDVDDIYKVPGMSDVALTFGWALFLDGFWHTEVATLNLNLQHF